MVRLPKDTPDSLLEDIVVVADALAKRLELGPSCPHDIMANMEDEMDIRAEN